MPTAPSRAFAMTSAPQRIGHYLMGKTLGVGTFGKVRLAIHEPTVSEVVFKLYHSLDLLDIGFFLPFHLFSSPTNDDAVRTW
jgi:hypothetical protein